MFWDTDDSLLALILRLPFPYVFLIKKINTIVKITN